MNKFKKILNIVGHIAVVAYILMVIWPALQSSDEGYSGAVAVISPVAKQVVEPEPALIPEPELAPESKPHSEAEPEVPPAPISDNDKEDEDAAALYSVVEGNKLDANSYAGFKLYRNWCSRCHGTYGQGLVGPNLADSLKVISEKEFFDTVENGKSGRIGSMPAWKANVKVMEGRDQLYAYLMARSDGAIGVEKPKKQ